MVQKNSHRLFVTFEGLDGSGKTTVVEEIQKWLNSLKIANIATREPGSSNPITNQIRSLVLNEKTPISVMGELLLYSLDRRINLEQQIWPALAANKVVLCDRYLDSSLVYQGYAGELGIEQVLEMQKFITRNTLPDITFLFELPLKQAKVRTQSRSKLDRFDAVNRQFRQMIHEGYDQVRKMFSNRFHIIDASRDRANVLQQVQTVLKKVLKLD